MSDSMVFTKDKKLKVSPIQESIYIIDVRDAADYNTKLYIYDFDENQVPCRVWKALSILKAAGKFCIEHVGDTGYKELIDDVADRRLQDDDFRHFFDTAMVKKNRFPRNQDETMKTIANCSWMVFLEEE